MRFTIKYLLPCWPLLLMCLSMVAQTLPDEHGYRHLQTTFQGDTVDILIKSKKGEEQVKKPLFLFCQGSLPQPLLITYDDNGKEAVGNVFVFNPDSLSKNYHLAIISKPYVPLKAKQATLNPDFTYSDSTGNFPRQYLDRYYLDYYVYRNMAVIRFLQQQPWVSGKQLVVAGHSEGSTIAAKLALRCKQVTQLIYSGGNPAGRILTIIARERAHENDSSVAATFSRWEKTVADPNNRNAAGEGDTRKATYDFSIPPIEYLRQLKIPVLVTFGTRDASAVYNDYLQVEMIRLHKKNFTFKAYTGTEHNYFPLKQDGTVNYDIFNWDKVATDWRAWLLQGGIQKRL